MSDPITPAEFYAVMDLSVTVDDDAGWLRDCFMGRDDLTTIVDAEMALICIVPKDKAATLVKILNASEALVDRSELPAP